MVKHGHASVFSTADGLSETIIPSDIQNCTISSCYFDQGNHVPNSQYDSLAREGVDNNSRPTSLAIPSIVESACTIWLFS
jgi:hypothetical protein